MHTFDDALRPRGVARGRRWRICFRVGLLAPGEGLDRIGGPKGVMVW
jgi:hypothetical protein